MQKNSSLISITKRHIAHAALIAGLVLAVCGIAIWWNADARLLDLARAYPRWHLGELPIIIAVLAGGACLYALLRWRTSTQLLAARTRIELALQEREQAYQALTIAAQRQAQELELLERARRVLAHELDLASACRTIVQAVADTFGYAQVSLYLLRGETLHLQHQVGYDQVLSEVPVTSGVAGRVVRTGQPVLLEDVRADPAFLGAIDGIVAEICVPLFDEQQVVGILNVESKQVGRLAGADLRLMVALGEHVGAMIWRARLYQEARESEERFRRLSEATLEGIVVHEQGLVIDVNQAFAAMIGQDPATLIGKDAIAFFPPESQLRIRDNIRLQMEQPYEAQALRPDGSTFPIEIQGRMIRYQGRMARVTAVRDISARQRQSAESQRRLRETLLLNRVIAAAASVLDPTAVLEIVCTELARAFDLPQAAAALLDADRSQLTVVAEYCAEGRPSGMGVIIPLDNNVATQTVLKQRTPLMVLDAQHDPRQAAIHELGRWRGTVSLLIVPLVIRDQVVGTIGLDSIEQREFSPEEIELAQNVANAASRALENAYLYVAVQQELTERHQAQQALYMERDFIAAVLDTAAALVMVLDPQGRIVRFNRACERITGYVFDEVSEQLFWDVLLRPEDSASVQSTFARICAGDFPSSYEQILVTRTGDQRLIAWSNSALLGQGGETEYVIATGIDITERKQVEEILRASEERFQLVVRATNEAIWDHNLLDQTVWWNDGIQTMFDYRTDEIAPTFQWWWERIHADEQTRVLASYQAALDQRDQFWSAEYRFRRGDGSYADVFDRAYVVYSPSGQPVRMIGSMMDITQRKQIDRMKNEFVATVSHELRTPLTSIHGALRLVTNGVTGPLTAPAQSMLAIANKNTERLIVLINDILDIEKIESGTMSFTSAPHELKALLEQALEATQAYGQQFQVTFVLEHVVPHAQVYSDGDRLIQVFTNLLSNAAKFSPPGECVRIAMTRQAHDLRVAISDCGPGIPEEFRTRIFQKFAQADSSSTRQKGGTGLGLSIARAIVERLGGQIGFDSLPGRGTTFYVELPEWHAAE